MTLFPGDLTPAPGVYQSEYHLGQTVAVIAPGVPQVPGQEIAQLQPLKKFVEEVDATEVRQTPMITGDSKISWRPTHSEPYLTKS